jgi:hypothetical protein
MSEGGIQFTAIHYSPLSSLSLNTDVFSVYMSTHSRIYNELLLELYILCFMKVSVTSPCVTCFCRSESSLGLEVFTEFDVTSTVFEDATPCCLVDKDSFLEGTGGARSSKRLVFIYHTTRRHIQKYRNRNKLTSLCSCSVSMTGSTRTSIIG